MIFGNLFISLNYQEGDTKMKRTRLLIIPVCCMLLFTPVSGIRAGAVTVDINDNYDAGLITQENDGNGKDEGMDITSASSSASSSGASTQGTSTQGTSATTPAASTETASTTPVVTTTSTTDLPKTGDDNRIMLTFIAMLASFSVFLTALVCGRHFGKND